MNPERLEELMVKAVDGIATPAETEELMTFLVDHPEHRAEFEQHRAIKAVTDGWVQRLEADLAEDQHAAGPLYAVERGIGWTLAIVATALLMGGGTWALFTDPEVPLWVSVGMGLGTAGFVVLLFSAVRWRLSTRKRDPYSEVIR